MTEDSLYDEETHCWMCEAYFGDAEDEETPPNYGGLDRHENPVCLCFLFKISGVQELSATSD